MQRNLIELLKNNGIELQRVILERGEEEDQGEEVYRIKDSERLIFIVEINDISKDNIKEYVNRLAEWITYEQTDIDQELKYKYNHISMRMILWDMYIIFVNWVSAENKKLHDENLYPLQRDSHLMKRYIVQGSTDEEMVEKISFITNPERIIDNFINKLNFESNETKYCKEMCRMKNEKEHEYNLKGETYQEILGILATINKEMFGEDIDEDTGN